MSTSSKSTKRPMNKATALQIVLDLAQDNVIDAAEMPRENARQEEAIRILSALLCDGAPVLQLAPAAERQPASAGGVRQALDKTNWPLLRDQKAALLSAIQTAEDGDQAAVARQLADALEGLLGFIDSIQDGAAADGYPVVWLEADADDDEAGDVVAWCHCGEADHPHLHCATHGVHGEAQCPGCEQNAEWAAAEASACPKCHGNDCICPMEPTA